MITLRCTKKLQKHLRLAVGEGDEPPTSALGDWYGNLLALPGLEPVVFFTNEQSLLTVVLPPGCDLFAEFRRRVLALLRRIGLPQHAVQREAFNLQQIAVGKTRSRRVLGSMNDTALQLEVRLFHQGRPRSLETIEDELARNLYSMTGYQRPEELARELLGGEPAAKPERALAPVAVVDEAAQLKRRPVYQLRVGLIDIEPEIWRRILVSGNSSLARVHEAIQIAMGWENYHLYEFRLADGGRFGPQDVDPDPETGDAKKVKLRRVASEGGTFGYLYDFGDGWRHRVEVEAILAPASAGRVARCVDGARACPPEDVGGPPGYARYLAALGDATHRDHAHLLGWRGPYDPELFEQASVNRALRSAFPSG